jgi:hypothetical protein
MEVVGSVAGGLISSSGAKSAAKAQAAATDRATQAAERQAKQIRDDLSPYRALGSGATTELAKLLGLRGAAMGGQSRDDIRARLIESGTYNRAPAASPVDYTRGTGADGQEQWGYQNPNRPGTIPEILAAFGGVAAGGGAQAAPGAYDESALNAEVERLWAMGEQERQAAESDPAFGSLMRDFTGEDLQNEPGYKFGLDEGLKALDRRFASGGGYFSGAALKGATRYGTDYAGTKYGEAFNRDAANKARKYNFLTGAVSTGQNASVQTGNAGQNMVNAVGANETALGNAQGASRIAQGNAWSGAINSAVKSYQDDELIKQLSSGSSGLNPAFYRYTNTNLGSGD